MFIVESKQANYCNNAFASSSCHTEYNSNEEAQYGLMRRNSSNLSQLTNIDLCVADATQIEIDFSSLTSTAFVVEIEAPTGEQGRLHMMEYGTATAFTPATHGCGHGMWKFTVRAVESNEILAREEMHLEGVGTLFFTVGNDFVPRLSGQEFLALNAVCSKHLH